ncbi:hypothetical protein CcaverHIS002_0205120 [Cutaneotrichosporon cavernicola]|uniref:Uncharacterized protein n=1 Tax=Cutaneotrichosporon cavernicola TaxID=279322 RepID=A0AA48IAD9_9TREE|nr:uncharacterized protein CcaverHIS019_0205090 [Cutaneotrichosporon cavernicola]BEI81352.1 hypothetical protein CcaverHIS002_0205120 [Cutaneotrichosporon cavernicola]BEI89147.1 hypothetical protein CcaverHIS019_0205090 [Cutaneotrichosporon cavernicola]BEI96924.1 hypothetical protein CcaverHIS631_0205130 [Cutaneotrichosporon cavernicola]BEJ04696.1 hypothetical protein CcaverHIS641_0205130 [Cutaneotrichosporon cavernicola]
MKWFACRTKTPSGGLEHLRTRLGEVDIPRSYSPQLEHLRMRLAEVDVLRAEVGWEKEKEMEMGREGDGDKGEVVKEKEEVVKEKEVAVHDNARPDKATVLRNCKLGLHETEGSDRTSIESGSSIANLNSISIADPSARRLMAVHGPAPGSDETQFLTRTAVSAMTGIVPPPRTSSLRRPDAPNVESNRACGPS